MSAKRWATRLAAGLLAATAVLVLSGATYESVMRRRAARDFPVPGKLVDVGGGRRIQIDCRGSGAPTVVLESGLDVYGSLAWAAVHDSIARSTRVCAYSRAGIMWSDPSGEPFSSTGVAKDLHSALSAAGERAPFVMVGHSLGGPYVMTFARLYQPEVVGIVLVDATHPNQFARYRDAVGKELQPSPTLAQVGAALAWTGLVRMMPGENETATWPAIVRNTAPTFIPTSVKALARETAAISATLANARPNPSLGDRPLVVLMAGVEASPETLRSMGLSLEQGRRLSVSRRALQEDEATWSRQSRLEIVTGASHYVQFDRPSAVIAAVRAVVRQK